MPLQGGALFAAPQELYGFIEFLRRAMLPGDDLWEGAAKRIATYGRELVYWLMAAEDAPRLERFVHAFCPEHNLNIGTLTPELQAAKILTYCMIIDAVMAELSPQSSPPFPANTRPPQIDWLALAQCGHHAIPTGILQGASQLC